MDYQLESHPDALPAGHLSTYRNVDVMSGQTVHLPDVALQTADMVLLDADTGGTAATSGGRADFPAAAFVTGSGAAYSGNVEVEISAALPGDSDFFDVFPGAFEGETEGGETVPFISYGFMGIEMFSEGRGEPLELADGVSAELAISLPPTAARAAPDSIPMWWFDTDRGVWVEDGMAYKVGNEFVTEVEHFTIWNWDLPVTDIAWVSGSVQDGEGEPVEGARVFSQGLGCTFMDDAYTDAGGLFRIRVIKECMAQFWALKGRFASQIEELEVTNETEQDLPAPLVLTVPAFSITLSWGLEPDDLDSHLLIPMAWNAEYDFYHLYYSTDGNMFEDPYTALDTDDTSSYGPEIISGTRLYNSNGRLAAGSYSYFVHHYSGYDDMGLSPAQVTLEVGNYYNTWLASTASGEFSGSNSDWWHVFNFTVSENGSVSVQPVNQAVVTEGGNAPWSEEGFDIWGDWFRGATK
jgi:hypothetical protein